MANGSVNGAGIELGITYLLNSKMTKNTKTVICPSCNENLSTENIKSGFCPSCKCDLRVVFLKFEGKVCIGLDSKLSGIK